MTSRERNRTAHPAFSLNGPHRAVRPAVAVHRRDGRPAGLATRPLAAVSFPGLGFTGYLPARRAGLERSQRVLRDTRLMLANPGVLAVAGAERATLITLEVLGVR